MVSTEVGRLRSRVCSIFASDDYCSAVCESAHFQVQNSARRLPTARLLRPPATRPRRDKCDKSFRAHVEHLALIFLLRRQKNVVPYSITRVGHGADPGFLAVRPAGDISHKPGGRLPSLFTRPTVTFPAKEITPVGQH